MTDFYLARQPIYDQQSNVLGYELLYRSNELNQANISDGDSATSQVLVSALLEMGLSEVVGDRLAFINITRNYVLGELPFPLARKQIVLEILEDILPNVEMLDALRQLKLRHSYTLALDDFEYDERKKSLIPFADYIKIDVLALQRYQIEEHVKILKKHKCKLIAEKVEDHESFEFCKQLGFDFYQGFFFCKPRILTGQQAPSNTVAIVNLLAELQNPTIKYDRLQGLIAKDVTITYRIIRYINSAKFNLTRQVDSISQAISLLGIKIITTWVTILAMAKFTDKPAELSTIALTRARMCEMLAKATNKNTEAAFMVGLFSVLDALIDKAMSDILPTLPLSTEIKIALERMGGDLGQILAMTIAYERGHWENEALKQIYSGLITSTYFESLNWAEDVRRNLLKPC